MTSTKENQKKQQKQTSTCYGGFGLRKGKSLLGTERTSYMGRPNTGVKRNIKLKPDLDSGLSRFKQPFNGALSRVTNSYFPSRRSLAAGTSTVNSDG
jgi:hypothetical protein